VTDFATSVDRLHNQVRHWEQGRWWSRTSGATATRGDLTFALIQRLADLGADAEQRPRRPVPREHDMVLPDQLRVLADDLLAAAGSEPRRSEPRRSEPALAGPALAEPALAEAVLAEAAAAVDELRLAI
jgi:hypothetical protein